MFFPTNSPNSHHKDNGSALVIALIVLAILGALGLASLEVADINTQIAANDRDSQAAFFHADSGANIAHLFLRQEFYDGNSTFYNATPSTWSTIFNATDFPLSFTQYPPGVTYIRAGKHEGGTVNPGTALNMGAGFEDPSTSAASDSISATFTIRSHRVGARNSDAEVDIGWQLTIGN